MADCPRCQDDTIVSGKCVACGWKPGDKTQATTKRPDLRTQGSPFSEAWAAMRSWAKVPGDNDTTRTRLIALINTLRDQVEAEPGHEKGLVLQPSVNGAHQVLEFLVLHADANQITAALRAARTSR